MLHICTIVNYKCNIKYTNIYNYTILKFLFAKMVKQKNQRLAYREPNLYLMNLLWGVNQIVIR